jgi:hypothetical protein
MEISNQKQPRIQFMKKQNFLSLKEKQETSSTCMQTGGGQENAVTNSDTTRLTSIRK